MTDALNPQAREMADESMVRTLAAQAEAIWPQERPLFERYGLAPGARIFDAGCGTGEIASRLATLLPEAEILGVDVLDGPLAIARARYGHVFPRLRFEQRSIFELGLPERSFDLVVCRHVLQAIPHVDRALAELTRVTRPGGRLHLIAEDYGMLHIQAGRLEPMDFWIPGSREFGTALGTSPFIGRNVISMLHDLGLTQLTADYVVVDTLRVARATFASILEAWRDGYARRSPSTPISRATRCWRTATT